MAFNFGGSKVGNLKSFLGKIKSHLSGNKRSLILTITGLLTSLVVIATAVFFTIKPQDIKKSSAAPLSSNNVDTYISALTNNTVVSGEASAKLLEKPDIAVPALIKALQENPPADLKGQAIFLLGKIGNQEAISELSKFSDDTNTYVRKNVAWSLGQIEASKINKEALDALHKLLTDPNEGVRMNASLALGELKDTASANLLATRLRQEKSLGVKESIVNSLGILKAKSTTSILLSEFNSPRVDKTYRDSVIFTLGEVADSKASSDLNSYLTKVNKEIQERETKQTGDSFEGQTNTMLLGQLKITKNLLDEAIKKISNNK